MLAEVPNDGVLPLFLAYAYNSHSVQVVHNDIGSADNTIDYHNNDRPHNAPEKHGERE
jgi:hypothetical protein